MKVSTIGLDIAKNVFHVLGRSKSKRAVLKRRLRRAQVLAFFAQLEPCVVGIEACSGAHYWARELQALGHQVRLLPPRAVKAYVQGAKNDFNDAAALCEALSNPKIHAVAVKTVEQHDWQMLHRLREATKGERTALVNRVRGLLSEYGIVIARGIGQLRRALPELLEAGDNGLSGLCRELLAEQYQQLLHLDEQMHRFDLRLKRLQAQSEPVRRLAEVPGLGPVLSSALPAHYGDACQFRNGRALASALGLVPHQHSTGGKPRLLGISKRGNPYLRALFVNGARAALTRAPGKSDPLSRWAVQVCQRRGWNKAVVALANKLARIAWIVLAREQRFDAART